MTTAAVNKMSAKTSLSPASRLNYIQCNMLPFEKKPLRTKLILLCYVLVKRDVYINLATFILPKVQTKGTLSRDKSLQMRLRTANSFVG